MTHRLQIVSTALLLLMAGVPAFAGEGARSAVQGSDGGLSIPFQGSNYFHRWSSITQHEFTPAGQEDLSAWKDMLTLEVYLNYRGEQGLAAIYEGVRSSWEGMGTILRTGALPTEEGAPPVYMIFAVLSSADFLEANVTKLSLAEGVAVAVRASHRIYGPQVSDAMNAWLEKTGTGVESELMAIDSFPSLASLSALAE